MVWFDIHVVAISIVSLATWTINDDCLVIYHEFYRFGSISSLYICCQPWRYTHTLNIVEIYVI
jgi:hypothetical protein